MGYLTELVVSTNQLALKVWNESQACKDAAIWRLPHPIRVQAMGIHHLFVMQYAPIWRALAEHLESEASYDEVMLWLSHQAFANSINEAHHALPGSINSGPTRIQMACLRFMARQAPVFQVTDALNELLAGSDLGDVPARHFRLPYPLCFVETGKSRQTAFDAGLRVDAVDGVYPLEGAYLLEDRLTVRAEVTVKAHAMQLYELQEGESVRVISLIVMGSPVGRSSLMDDMGYTQSLYIREQDEDLPLEQILDRHAERYQRRDAKWGGDDVPEMVFDTMKAAVLHIAKAVLYVGSKSARLAKIDERSDADRRLERLKPGKRAKLERRSLRLYDHVVVGPSELPQDLRMPRGEAGREGYSVRPHWRRGHFHTVLFGPGRSERRLEFFMPTLVRQDLLGGAPAPDARPYRIT